ncbi:MAG TPA: hypothetical protein PLG22_04325 [Kiritimatiellia bacterium]|nr:hypothetical protein [Kiritimatiellia bacterium]
MSDSTNSPIAPDDRLRPLGGGSGEPTFTLVRLKAFQKPALEEELIAPPGGSGTPCACNSVCGCVPVQQCACDTVCSCDAVSSCDPYESPCYSCWVVCIRFIIFH